MAKISKAARLERIGEVYRLLLTGSNRRTIIKYAEKKGWGIGDRTIDQYIAIAMKELTTESEERKEKLKAIARRRLDDLYSRSYLINDFKTCLSVLKETNELNGLKKEQVEHTVNLTDMDLLRRQVDETIAANPDARTKLAEKLAEDNKK